MGALHGVVARHRGDRACRRAVRRASRAARWHRALLLTTGLVGVVLLQQTAEHAARDLCSMEWE